MTKITEKLLPYSNAVIGITIYLSIVALPLIV